MSPKKPCKIDAPSYPTLSDFAADRRAFMRTLGVAAATLVTGSWSAVALGEGPPEMDHPGTMPVPQEFSVQLTSDQLGTARIRGVERLLIDVVLFTYVEDFVFFAADHEQELADAIKEVLATRSCEEIESLESLVPIESAVTERVNALFAESSSYTAAVKGSQVTVVRCWERRKLAGKKRAPTID